MMEKESFLAIFRLADGEKSPFYGELKSTVMAADFPAAAAEVMKLEAHLESLNFTLASIEYIG